MKIANKISIVLLAATSVVSLCMLPRTGTDAAKLLPAQVLMIAQKDGRITVESDNGASGSGATLPDALAAMREGAEGTLFLDTAEHIILLQSTQSLLPAAVRQRQFRPAAKLYLARMPKEELAEEESRRWAEIIEMSLNLEQASDIVERMGSEIADKSLAARRAFSLDGLKELDALYEQLLSNLKLAMSVFFSGDVTSARLRRSKHRFRILNRRYSHAHVDRLHQQNVQSIETSSLHLGLLGDMQRLNSLFCSVAYSVLEQPDEDEGRDEY